MSGDGQSPKSIEELLSGRNKPALLIGNGINRFNNDNKSSWLELLETISHKQGVLLTQEELKEMSNTERYDILDLEKPSEDRRSLQKMFCAEMKDWKPGSQHARIVEWAERHERPIITLNFDENLSKSIKVPLLHNETPRGFPGFTAHYPWDTYFAAKEVTEPEREFAIWHAHGMMRYSQSIRLGLRHYMGSVARARQWIQGRNKSLLGYAQDKAEFWRGSKTWLHAFFFSDIAMFGLEFGKDETFLRWLFLERARFFKRFPGNKRETYFIATNEGRNVERRPFFKRLGMNYIVVNGYKDIYESTAWEH